MTFNTLFALSPFILAGLVCLLPVFDTAIEYVLVKIIKANWTK
jgi:hypothetical protein